jgi:hypothetical protein
MKRFMVTIRERIRQWGKVLRLCSCIKQGQPESCLQGWLNTTSRAGSLYSLDNVATKLVFWNR